MAHVEPSRRAPPNITLLPLPPKCPELNPTENIWEFMRDNWLSNRIYKSYVRNPMIVSSHSTAS
jgi:transposase